MFKNVIRFAALSLLRKWLSPSSSPASFREQSVLPMNLNWEKIKVVAVRYASFAILAFLNFLLFVGGVIVTAVAAAHSIDTYAQFQATSVFWAGLIISGTGLVLGVACGWAFLSTKFDLRDFVHLEEAKAPQLDTASLMNRLIRPMFEGVLAGLTTPRARRERAYTVRDAANSDRHAPVA